MKYLLQRIAFYLFTAWAAITLNFFIPRIIPGDPVKSLIARFQGQMSTDAIESLYVLFGLDKNESMWEPVRRLLEAALPAATSGLSFTFFPTPVSEVIGRRAAVDASRWSASPPCSASSSAPALGVLAGWRRGSWIDGAAAGHHVPVLDAVLLARPASRSTCSPGRTASSRPPAATTRAWCRPGTGTSSRSAIQHSLLPALTILISSVSGWILEHAQHDGHRRRRRTTSPSRTPRACPSGGWR